MSSIRRVKFSYLPQAEGVSKNQESYSQDSTVGPSSSDAGRGTNSSSISWGDSSRSRNRKDPEYGLTPLLWASINGQEEAVRALLKTGGVDLSYKDAEYGRTPLLWAAERGHNAVVELLLSEDGVNPNLQDILRRTPLSNAAKNGHDIVVQLLLATGYIDVDSKDVWGRTALSYAAMNGHDTVVNMLLATGCVDPDPKDALELTPLSNAAQNGHDAVAKLLLAADGVDPDSRDIIDQTPLSNAAENGHEAVAKLLLATGCIDPDSKDAWGRTPLLWASRNGHDAVVKLLLATDGVDPDHIDYECGRTPLLWASTNGFEDVVRLLLEKKLTAKIEGSTLLETALSDGCQNIVYRLLSDYFDHVAQGNFGWLLDLKDEGFEADDIASLLLEMPKTDPWTDFGKSDVNTPEGNIDPDLHQSSCAHKQPPNTKADSAFDPVALYLKRDDMQRRIATFCGLAGVFPPQIQGEVSKQASFAGTKASVIYNDYWDEPKDIHDPSSGPSQQKLVAQLHEAMQGIIRAALTLQQTGFGCNQFTILTAYENDLDHFDGFRVVYMNSVPFDMLMGLANEIASLEKDGISESHLFETVSISITIMQILFRAPSYQLLDVPNERHKLHWCSLTVQVLCLGMVLYSQGHTGKLHPLFLTNSLTEVTLRGSLMDYPYIVARRQKLACMGRMIGDEVFVFRINDPSSPIPPSRIEKSHLSATCEEIVDSWGPGYFIADNGNLYGDKLYGLGIRGGIIKPDRDSSTGLPLFHWGSEFSVSTSQSKTFSYWEKITIGTITADATSSPSTPESNGKPPSTTASNSIHSKQSRKERVRVTPSITPFPDAGGSCQGPKELSSVITNIALPLHAGENREIRREPASVSTNTTCPLDSGKCRQRSGSYLCSLGTAPDYWALTEIQSILQAGNYVQLQVGTTITKQTGIPLKRVLLDRWTREQNLSLFEEPWGLQVSLCTGVARRVPLRVLIEEPLFRYIDNLNIDGWKKLEVEARDAIRGQHGFIKWTQKLDEDERRCMQTIFGKLLYLLKDTGFDRSGKHLSILWPHESDARFCVRIRPEDQLWCSMLKDSEWCATFAVATPLCLETREHKCRKTVAAAWCGGKMLSTVVCPNLSGTLPCAIQTTAAEAKWQLENKERYWIGKCGGDVLLVVHKLPSSVTVLEVKRNRLPGPLASRVWGDRLLMERPDTAFQEAEEVFVLHRNSH
ncbi:hypothetical protein F5Y10DRAFT_294334 [Nemania abortiva]|nr:hypothetical protein F5Y10DRAFT_294334 [Nemania abortiva]